MAVSQYRRPTFSLSSFCRGPIDSGGAILQGMDFTRRVPAILRSLYVQVSAASFVVVLFFALTGLTLNHPRWVAGAERTTVYRSALDPEWTNPSGPADVAKLDIVEELRSAHGVRGEVADFRVDEARCRVSFVAPGYSANASIDRRTGAYELTVVRRGLEALVNDLHSGRGGGAVWSRVIDLSAVLLATGSLTGLALVFILGPHRLATLLSLTAGGAILCLLYAVWVP
jgi:hypothetical protein